jgi:aspartyl-tRNA(Asn)/glutamyl-tRNA(Gln) amidotransferase subunit A
MSVELTHLSVAQLQAKLYAKEVTARQLVEAYRASIAKDNARLNVYLETFDDADEIADTLQKKIDAGERLPLLGVPYAMKDNILIEGKKASAASKALEGYVAPYSATVSEKLAAAGAICLGRVNMDEFAMGGSTENSAFGPTRNPRDDSRVPGGTSGGSAAAVAADMAAFAIGSDTGGSIRQPSAFCGVVGLKPTYGAVSRHGLIAMTSSFDVIGPIGRTVDDVALVFDVIAGKDPMDGTTADAADAARKTGIEAKPQKRRIGVPRAFVSQGLDEDIKANFEASVEALAAAGYEIVDVTMGNLLYSLAAYYVIMPAEVSSNMARFDGIRFGAHKDGANLLEDYVKTRGETLGAEVRRRIILGTYVLSSGYYDAYYAKAIAIRQAIRKDFTDALAECDAIAMPVSPVAAFEIGERSHDPLQMYLADIFTVSANLAGVPAISIPCGTVSRTNKAGTKADLPLGLQLLGAPFGEQTLFDIGRAFEKIKGNG